MNLALIQNLFSTPAIDYGVGMYHSAVSLFESDSSIYDLGRGMGFT